MGAGTIPLSLCPGRNTGKREMMSPLKSLTKYKRSDTKRSQETNTQNYIRVKHNRSHHQVVPKNRRGKAEGGKALFIFCLFFTFTSGPRICEEHAQMCDASGFPQWVMSISHQQSLRNTATERTQCSETGTIRSGSAEEQCPSPIPEQPAHLPPLTVKLGNICKT